MRLYEGEQGQQEVLQKERTKTVVLPTPIRIGVNGQVLKEVSFFDNFLVFDHDGAAVSSCVVHVPRLKHLSGQHR